LASVCPDDAKPTSCSCTRGDQDTLELPVESIKEFFQCRPDTCRCPDGSDIEIPLRPADAIAKVREELLEDVNTACNGESPATCT
jgi:hypothetical protein